MSGHTEGPWEWRRFGMNTAPCLVAPQGRGIPIVMDFARRGLAGATALFRVDGVMRRHEDHLDHPDARLVAAAPDLLAALELCLLSLERGVEPPGLRRTARAAIAKARGGEGSA